MKVAIVSPVPTLPCTAGNRARVAALVDAVRALGHEVHFIYISMEAADRPAMESQIGPERLHWINYQGTPEQRRISARLIRTIRRRLRHERAWVWGLDDWYDENSTFYLRELDRIHDFDVVMVEYVFMSKALTAFGRALKIVDTHDIFANRHRSYLAHGEIPRWYSTSLADEDRGLRRADRVIAIQAEEAATLSARLHDNPHVITVSHIVDNRRIPLADIPAATFFASTNPINIKALKYFHTYVYPLVQKRLPEFRLVIAGGICTAVPDCLYQLKLGIVSEPAEAFTRAPLAINPVQMGTGINVKLLESLGVGIPVVSTVTGARGLDASARDAVEVVPDMSPELFASAIIHLLSDKKYLHAKAEAAHVAGLNWNRKQMAALQSAVDLRTAENNARFGSSA